MAGQGKDCKANECKPGTQRTAYDCGCACRRRCSCLSVRLELDHDPEAEAVSAPQSAT